MSPTRIARVACAACIALARLAAGAQETAGDYATDLGRVYGAYQRMLALKEACDRAAPETRSANDPAFGAWLVRHSELVQELQRRVTAMIRLASRDERDFVRNVGKYEGAILRERREYRDTLLALGAEELRAQCASLPAQLNGPQADLARVYAAELKSIRARR